MRIFADANVLFDIFAQREPFQATSRKLLVMQEFGDAELWTAPQSYLNIFYVLRKAQPADAVQRALGESLRRINLCSTTHEDMKSALAAGWDDVGDALIGISCRKVGADYLLTRDGKQPEFAALGIPALTPEEFFKHLEEENGIVYEELLGDDGHCIKEGCPVLVPVTTE